MNKVHILDVRTTIETDKEQTRIRSAQLIPINELRDRINEIPKDKRVMTIYRSGKRSVLAANILREMGWQKLQMLAVACCAGMVKGFRPQINYPLKMPRQNYSRI